MIYVGIPIAKLNLFASAISSDGEVHIHPFKFTNDGDSRRPDSFQCPGTLFRQTRQSHPADAH